MSPLLSPPLLSPPRLALLACALAAALSADPSAIGLLQDDALYLDAARACATGEGLRLELLPGDPGLVKYPPLYPLLLACVAPWPAAALGLQVILWVAALAALELALRAWRLEPWPRAGVIALLGLHPHILRPAAALLSEPLALLALALGWAALATLLEDPAEEDDGRARSRSWALLLGAIALTPLIRSAAAPMWLAPILAFAGRRRWGAAAACLAALGLPLALRSALAAAGAFGEPPAPPLEYFGGYGYHLGYYTDAPPALALRRLGAVASANLSLGLQSLGRLLDPSAALAEAAGATGSATLARVVGGVAALAGLAGLLRRSPALALALAPAMAMFLVWTWPFSQRFWILLLPLLALGWRGLLPEDPSRAWRRGFNLGLGALVAAWLPALLLSVLPAAPAPALDPGPSQPGRRVAWAFEANIAMLAEEAGAEDVLIGGFHALWMARRAGCKAAWVEVLLPRDAQLERSLGLRPDGALGAEERAAVVSRLEALRGQVSGRLLWRWDLQSPPWTAALVQELEREGRLRRLRSDPAGTLFEVT